MVTRQGVLYCFIVRCVNTVPILVSLVLALCVCVRERLYGYLTGCLWVLKLHSFFILYHLIFSRLF